MIKKSDEFTPKKDFDAAMRALECEKIGEKRAYGQCMDYRKFLADSKARDAEETAKAKAAAEAKAAEEAALDAAYASGAVSSSGATDS